MKRIATVLLLALLVPLHAYSQVKYITYWGLSENQPDTDEGGRANTIAVHPTNPSEMYVASDSGGLFKTIDRGQHWTHVDSLGAIFTQSVAYLDSSTILVSAKPGFTPSSGGVVWRSSDAGQTWTPRPLTAPGTTAAFSSYEISTFGGVAVVATDQGVFVSTDSGWSWQYSNPFVNLSSTVKAVMLVADRGTLRVYAGGPAGIRTNTVPLTSWRAPLTNLTGINSMHAFGHVQFESLPVFVTTGSRLFRTQDSGSTWTQIAPPSSNLAACNGQAFVRAALRTENNITYRDVYFGNQCGLFRMAAQIMNGTADYTAPWQLRLSDRYEPRDLAFFDAKPLLMATNGGLHTTGDLGAHWHYAGGGGKGYGAMQITEVKGQLIGQPQADLYFGTRDNNVRWMRDAGETGSASGVGFFFDAERSVSSPDDARITYKACGVCVPVRTGWHLMNSAPMNAPGGMAAPVLIRHDEYVQNVAGGLARTTDAGGDWQSYAMFGEEPRGIPKLGRAGANDFSIVYQAYRANLSGPPSEGATRLIRVGYSQGNGLAVYSSMAGFGGLASDPIQDAALYPVFGVDSHNALHVIAPDRIAGTMKETWDGGENWTEIPGLTALVTNNGARRFSTKLDGIGNDVPLVTAISFYPDDPKLVLIGTIEGGIYFSGDRGATWRQLTNTERASYVTGFFWKNQNTVFVSTYGRGMWKLANRRIAIPGAFDEICATCGLVAQDGSPDKPAFDGSALVFGGRILGVRTEKGILRELFVTPGSSVVFTGDQNDPQDDIAITESDGTDAFEPLPKGPDGWIAAGVVFAKGDELTGTAFAKSELIAATPGPDEDAKGPTDSPVKGTPYVRLATSSFDGVPTAAPSETFELDGTDFVAGVTYEVLVDGEAMKETTQADGNGAFAMKLTAPAAAGFHLVQVRAAGDEKAIDGSTLLVK